MKQTNDDIQKIKKIANDIFTGEPKTIGFARQTCFYDFLPEENEIDNISIEEYSEYIVSILSIICSFGIKIMFENNFHPQNIKQILKINQHLKCLGWQAIFTCKIKDDMISHVKINFELVQ